MYTLMALPYAPDALAPIITANTISFHHGKHHKTYVDNLNNLVKGTEFEGQSLEAIVTATAGKADKAPFKSPVKAFHLTNAIARASKIMAECAALAAGSAKVAAE